MIKNHDAIGKFALRGAGKDKGKHMYINTRSCIYICVYTQLYQYIYGIYIYIYIYGIYVND
jgi:hypothetical protein